MNTDLQQITAQLATVAESLTTLQEALALLQAQTQQPTQTTTAAIQNSDQLIPFTALLMIELTPHFGTDATKIIVDCLEKCRKIGGYNYFSRMYKYTGGDVQKRKLLMITRCAYQLKFTVRKNDPYRYKLRSDINLETECPYCGKLANALYDRLVKEGLF